jgi:hypothetical protein
LDVEVTEGVDADLEIITPAAIAGVVGTKFIAKSHWDASAETYQTDLEVSKGAVKFTGRKGADGWEPLLVRGGESQVKKATKLTCQTDPKDSKSKKSKK